MQADIGNMAEKWVVITTISYPMEAVKKLAAMPGWRLVVVAGAYIEPTLFSHIVRNLVRVWLKPIISTSIWLFSLVLNRSEDAKGLAPGKYRFSQHRSAEDPQVQKLAAPPQQSLWVGWCLSNITENFSLAKTEDYCN